MADPEIRRKIDFSKTSSNVAAFAYCYDQHYSDEELRRNGTLKPGEPFRLIKKPNAKFSIDWRLEMELPGPTARSKSAHVSIESSKIENFIDGLEQAAFKLEHLKSLSSDLSFEQKIEWSPDGFDRPEIIAVKESGASYIYLRAFSKPRYVGLDFNAKEIKKGVESLRSAGNIGSDLCNQLMTLMGSNCEPKWTTPKYNSSKHIGTEKHNIRNGSLSGLRAYIGKLFGL